MNLLKQQLIILGAGKSNQFLENPAIITIDDTKRTLDWLLSAFDPKETHYTFVGGYQIEKITKHYPQLHFILNPEWDHTGALDSLRLAEIDPSLPAFICYGDILIQPKLVESILQASQDQHSDVILALDSGLEGLDSKPNLETVYCNFDTTTAHKPIKQAFIGLMYLKPTVLKALKESFPENIQEPRLSGLIPHLLESNANIQVVEANGLWAEVLKPEDVSRFVLTTKAQTLQTLRKRITKAKISSQVHFSVKEWRNQPTSIIEKIQQKFGSQALVVRSSSLQEDGFKKANAGKFESLLNIAPTLSELKEAIETVIASYEGGSDKDQILVQPMLQNVKYSGVAFTRSLNCGAPYCVINYDGKDTASVTSGTSQTDQIFYHWKLAPLPQHAPEFFPSLYEAIQEIEHLAQFDALDIEFAITEDRELYIFQVRPLVLQHLRELNDESLDQHLRAVAQRFEDLQTGHPFVVGEKTIFGVMPDWNPAEIVGIKPKTLAISLYQELITNAVWAQQRAEFGYKDVRPYPLITCFAGHPYIDVRASIHSFLPAALETGTTQKLVNYYVERLRQHPEWHDKLEFMVMPTCETFDFDERWQSLLTQGVGLSPEEFTHYKMSLRALTQAAFNKCSQEYTAMDRLNQRFDAIVSTPLAPYDHIYILLETCKQGTLNFAHLARCGFIASSFIKSALAQGIVTEQEKDALLDPIQTITGAFFEETHQVLKGNLPKAEFIHKYGHLRPGTYDITSPAYKTDPNKYMFSQSSKAVEHQKHYQPFSNPAFEELLHHTFGVNLEQFKRFLEEAIAGREYSKFVFTRYISAILDLIEALGRDYGLTAQDLAHLPISTIVDIKHGILKGENIANVLKKEIEQGQDYHRITQAIELPPLITQTSDFFSFALPKTLPNFIGSQSIQAALVYLENSKETQGEALKGKIVLIEKADPGFDWIFNYAIGGLITVYGGPNSHMAIRSAEFKLAASIGIGNALFEKLKLAQFIELDCASQSIKIIH